MVDFLKKICKDSLVYWYLTPQSLEGMKRAMKRGQANYTSTVSEKMYV